MRLHNKVAIVTGGGSGFGAGIVKKFSEEGAKVIVADINISGAKEIAKSFEGFPVEVDVSNSESFKNMVNKTLGHFERIDIIVNNAGITHLPKKWKRLKNQILTKYLRSTQNQFFLVQSI